ncbi:hypothetical protein QNI16_33825 [Cytophagaceae bacterium YF14B1]|uniref:Uncharacterized protein n=1 Tax=Xanthocytophaga flava TaxID=3048013 RepID=A0AAE3U9V8_9BACT|nr:hypothetical protein [Xanthocytophaga flavus]MDJ1485519.1 hypothetical protein [Xanthocytophaga flavus]
MITRNKIFVGLVVVLFDLFVGVFFGVAMMDYDDSYMESKGEYWSWESMNDFQKGISVGINIWVVINLFILGFIIYRLIKRLGKIPGF